MSETNLSDPLPRLVARDAKACDIYPPSVERSQDSDFGFKFAHSIAF